MNKTWREFTDLIGGRKFIVFVISTILLVLKFINQDVWLWTVVIYSGANIADVLANKINVTIGGK